MRPKNLVAKYFCFFNAVMRRGYTYLALVAIWGAFAITSALANPGFGASLELKSRVRDDADGGAFVVPSLLRGRVDFWKDVFSKYGAAQVVVHHRDFPQIVFGVLDLSREQQELSPLGFDKYKESVTKRTVNDIHRQLLELATGKNPETPFQEKLVTLLAVLPGGPDKYRNMVEQDLIRTQTGIRERYAEAIKRAWRYLPVMEQIFVSEYGLPRELTRIPFIESSFDYTAYSSVGAAGIWQFMPRTARAHRLMVGKFVDERRDPIKATRAAAEYLRAAFNSLGTWPLAITSYNHGIGGVSSKVRKAGTQDLANIIEDPNQRYFGFASTNFYPEFLAALEIFADPTRYFPDVQQQPPLQVVSYQLRTAMSADQIRQRLGISTEELQEANYALLDGVWKGRARIPVGYTLRVPTQFKEQSDRFFHGSGVAYAPVVIAHDALPATYVVKRGEDIDIISRKLGVSRDSILRMNGLSSVAVRPGKVLRLIERGSEVAVVPVVKRQVDSSQRASSKKVQHVVKRGETLGVIAKRHGVSVEQVKRANSLRTSDVRVGQLLRIP